MKRRHEEHNQTSRDSNTKVSDYISSFDMLQHLFDAHIEKLDAELKDALRNENVEIQNFSFEKRISYRGVQSPTVTELQKNLADITARPPFGTQNSWFIGPKGENLDELINLASFVIERHKVFRQRNPDFGDSGQNAVEEAFSGSYIDTQNCIMRSDDYKRGIDNLKAKLAINIDALNEGSIPFQRFGYIAHMNWDNTLPGVLGWIIGVLYNQNNIAAEASPVTTLMEINVSRQLCHMIGYPNTPPVVTLGKKDLFRATHDDTGPIPWGKITCDGTVANIESVWMARNFRYFCLACRQAMLEESILDTVRHHEHSKLRPTGSNRKKYFVDCSEWEVINLIPEEFFDFLDRVARLLSSETSLDISKGHEILHSAIEGYDVRALGVVEFSRKHPVIANMPRVIAAATRHYSWPKAVTMLGLGSNSLVSIPVGMDGRVKIDQIDKAIDELIEKKIPILLVVSVHGSTIEGAVDKLDELIAVRDKYRARGIDFLIHVDAAWGGYFQSLIVESEDSEKTLPLASLDNEQVPMANAKREPPYVKPFAEQGSQQEATHPSSPISSLKPSITPAFHALKKADSITVDPHKSGYIPYPAGGLLVRDSRLRERIAVRAPIVYKGKSDPTVSWYGIEGSRSGAAAVATWITHTLVPLDKQGYGEILGKCLFNSTLIYAAIHYMAIKSRNVESPESAYFVTTIPHLDIRTDEQKAYLERLITDDVANLTRIMATMADDLSATDRLFQTFVKELGSDTAIIAYIFTPAQFIGDKFVPHTDVRMSNFLNKELYDEFSLLEYLPRPDDGSEKKDPELFLSSSIYDKNTHGEAFLNELKDTMRVTGKGSVDALVTTTMNPWFLDAPSRTPKYPDTTPFPREDMVSYVMGILDNGVKRILARVT